MKRICAWSWTITKNHCMMHGQQNVKYCKADGLVFHCGMCFIIESFTVDAFKEEDRSMSGTSDSMHWLQNNRRLGYVNHFLNLSSRIFWSYNFLSGHRGNTSLATPKCSTSCYVHSFIQCSVRRQVQSLLQNESSFIVRSRASSFKWEYPLLSLRSSSTFLHLLPRLLVTSISPIIFPSITCFRRQFLRKVWPIQLAFRFLISCRIFLCSLTLTNT